MWVGLGKVQYGLVCEMCLMVNKGLKATDFNVQSCYLFMGTAQLKVLYHCFAAGGLCPQLIPHTPC